MKTRILVALTVAFALPLLAQEKPASSEKEKDIRKLLELTGSEKIAIQTADQMINQFRQTMPQVPAEFWDEFRKEMKAKDLIDMIVPVYDRNFEHDEIKEIIQFYESPVGRKLAAAQPKIMQESMEVGRRWGMDLGAKIMLKLQNPAPPAEPKEEKNPGKGGDF